MAKVHSRDGHIYFFRKSWCRQCDRLAKCCKGNLERVGRMVYVSKHWLAYEEARKHNETVAFEEAYGKRGRIESKIWELVYHGARRCRYRGNLRSKVQLLVTVVVVNAKRLVKLLRDGLERKPSGAFALKAA